MALLHSCLVARVRHPAEGEEAHVILSQATGISGLGTVSGPVVAAYHELMSSSPEAVEARQRYSALVLIVDNGHRANHEFPDLDAAASNKAKAAEIRAANEDAKAAASNAAKLKKQLDEANAAQSLAAATLANLTGAPIDPESDITPPDLNGDQGAVGADPQGGTPPAAPPIGQSPAIDPPATGASATSGAHSDPPVDPVLAIAARLQSGEDVTPEELTALTEKQLRSLGERYDIAMPASAKKSDLVELLLANEEA